MQSQQGRGQSNRREQHRNHDIEAGRFSPVHEGLPESFLVKISATAAYSSKNLSITGDKTLKLLTVHIVDKGQPMMHPAK
jgi:hypothetical protein